jgi:hypothetical protein
MVLKKVSLLANGHAIIDQKVTKQTYFLKNIEKSMKNMFTAT